MSKYEINELVNTLKLKLLFFVAEKHKQFAVYILFVGVIPFLRLKMCNI